MTQQQLRDYLDRLVSTLEPRDRNRIEARLKSLVSAFPFNEYEFILMFLRDRSVITFPQYEELRRNYVDANRYLNLFGLAPRIFGQVWGEQHLRDLDARFQKPDPGVDPDYEGQYDLWIEGVRVEAKAARAIDTKHRGELVSKALRSDSDRPFWMNFQQLKLDACDTFVFIGVWVDCLRYWVLSREEVRQNPYLSHQHRGGVEYQIGITKKNIREFDRFLANGPEVADRVIAIGQKSKTQTRLNES
jgi:hypothetical protein